MTHNTPLAERQNTCVRLKDVSEEKMAAYFEALVGYDPQESYSRDQANIIAANVNHTGLAGSIIRRLADEGVGTLTISTFVFAFQLGRDFEIREMARAMRGSNASE